MRISGPLRFPILFLTILFQIGCRPNVPVAAEVSASDVKPDLRIGQMEITMKEQDLAYNFIGGALVFNRYQYYRDSQHVGIRIPVSGWPDLFLYAFKSYKEPSALRLYYAQLYPAFPYTDSAFYGEIRWLNLQDYTLYYAQYKNGKVISSYPFGRLDFLQKQYDAYHKGRPPVPPGYPLHDTAVRPCLECRTSGMCWIETESGFHQCLFEMPSPEVQKGIFISGFPAGALRKDVPEVAPSGAVWKTPIPSDWQVLKDDIGVEASRFYRTEGITFYPPIAAF